MPIGAFFPPTNVWRLRGIWVQNFQPYNIEQVEGIMILDRGNKKVLHAVEIIVEAEPTDSFPAISVIILCLF